MRFFRAHQSGVVEIVKTIKSSNVKCDPIKCPHERCPANGDATLCPIVQNGVSMKITDKRSNVLRLENLKAKQVFEYVNKGHTAHRSMYQVLERTQYLDKQPIGIYVLDLRTLKVRNHYPKKRVKLIEEHKTREMPKELREMLEAVGRLESMAEPLGIKLPEMPPEIRNLFRMLELPEIEFPEIKVVEVKSISTCFECPMKLVCPLDKDAPKCPIAQMMRPKKTKKTAPPSVGTIKEKTVYEYIDQRNEWAQGYFMKLNQYQRLTDRKDPAMSWVINLSNSRLCHHRNSNPVRILDAEFTVNG